MKEKLKIAHISTIIIGIIFISLGIFHNNAWFDEAYSIGIATHSYSEIWQIGGNDVHPILYYWILRIIGTLTSGSLIAYRIFSCIPIAILGILGYTHIRKDFDEKTGFLFSLFSYFLPVCAIYAGEIRMYSWAILLVTILAIYANRLTKKDSIKNWIIFGITSLLCIYTHYYGLMAAGLINVFLLIYLIKNKRKNGIIAIVSFGVLQLALYIPWLLYFIKQLSQVSHGFWIGFTFPNTIIELVSAQFIGNLHYYLCFAAALFVNIYLGYTIIKNKTENKPAILSLGIYLAVIVAAILMTIVLGSCIIYFRYLFVVTGLYIFGLSYALAHSKNKYMGIAVCSVIIILGIISNLHNIYNNYSETNGQELEYIEENLQGNDVFVYSDIGAGSIMAINFTQNKQYFYNEANWGVEEAYKAFGPQMQTHITKDFLKECNSRIWVVDSLSGSLYSELFDNEEYAVISEKTIETAYHEYKYKITLVEPVNKDV